MITNYADHTESSPILIHVGWSMYGCMKRDYFIFWGNMPGLVLGLFYAISVLPFLCKKVQSRPKITINTFIGGYSELCLNLNSFFLYHYLFFFS